MKNYYIKAIDGDLGHAEEFIVDDDAWAIRYLVMDTKNWLPARKVLMSPQLTPINRGYEEHLYDDYGQERYGVP